VSTGWWCRSPRLADPSPGGARQPLGEVDLPGGAGSRPEIHRLTEQTVGILQPPKELS
jgi:hypothetical protein